MEFCLQTNNILRRKGFIFKKDPNRLKVATKLLFFFLILFLCETFKDLQS